MEPFARNTKNFETDTKKPEGASMAEGAVHALKSWVWGSGEEVKTEQKHARESSRDGPLPPTLPPQPLHEPHDGREAAALPTEPPPSAKMGTEPLQVEASSQEASLDELVEGASTTEEQQRLASLQQKEEALKKENAELEAEAKRLDDENKSLEGKAQLATLEKEKAGLQAEADRLQQEGQELEAAAGKVLSTEQLKRLMDMTQAELEDEVKKLQAQAAEYHKERDRVVSENGELMKEVKGLEEIKELRGKNKVLEAKIGDAAPPSSAIEDAAETLSAAELQELADLQGTNAKLAEQIHAQDAENAELRERVEQLESQKVTHERVVALEQKARADDAEKEKLRARIAELEASSKGSMEVAADGKPVHVAAA